MSEEQDTTQANVPHIHNDDNSKKRSAPPVPCADKDEAIKRIKVEEEPTTSTTTTAVAATTTTAAVTTITNEKPAIAPAALVGPDPTAQVVAVTTDSTPGDTAATAIAATSITAQKEASAVPPPAAVATLEPKSGSVSVPAATITPTTTTLATTTLATANAPPVLATTIVKQEDTAAFPPPAPAPPLKAVKMSHLRTKYTGELEYMLREFRKLERQLLGAKGATQMEESAGSRERREKLHSFILHLEDTIRQIELGCKLEDENELQDAAAVAASGGTLDATAMANNRAKEGEENVQKLEEHILANLLPVKVRLKKQLAAQQGATRNPAGMPAPRRGMLLQPSEADRGKGTFAAAAEQKRKEAEALAAAQRQQLQPPPLPPAEPVHPDQTHFGKPLGHRGSSLTQKLHGPTLGSQERKHGHGVGWSSQPPPSSTSSSTHEPTTTTYRGITSAGSQQVEPDHHNKVGAQHAVLDPPPLKDDEVDVSNDKPAGAGARPLHEMPTPSTVSSTTAKEKTSNTINGASSPAKPSHKASNQPTTSNNNMPLPPIMAPSETAIAIKKKLEDPTLTDEERIKLRRKLKKKLLLRRARRREYERQRQVAMQQAAQTQGASKASGGRKKAAGGKLNGKKRGPRSVEYICALCSEAYSSVCDYNPWWALAQHECPKCRKTQIPRVDISAPANAIEYHPALLAHNEDNGTSTAATTTESVSGDVQVNQEPSVSNCQVTSIPGEMVFGSDSEFGSDLSDITDGNLSDVSLDSNDSDAQVLATMAPAEKAEHEKFGFEYKGPKLSDTEASRLLILMLHANGCPCRHKNAQQRDVCRSTKFLMLHVRDCPGTNSSFDVCPFPWCRKVKHLLYHLVSCAEPTLCAICSPTNLSPQMRNLVQLNEYRLKRQRECLLASYEAGVAAQPTEDDPNASVAKPSTVTSCTKPNAVQRGAAPSKPEAAAIRSKPQDTANSATQPTVQVEKPALIPPAPSGLQPSGLAVKPVGTQQETKAMIPDGDPKPTQTAHATQTQSSATVAPAVPAQLQTQTHATVAVVTTPPPGSVGSSTQPEQPTSAGPPNPTLALAQKQVEGPESQKCLTVVVAATAAAPASADGKNSQQPATQRPASSVDVVTTTPAPGSAGVAASASAAIEVPTTGDTVPGGAKAPEALQPVQPLAVESKAPAPQTAGGPESAAPASTNASMSESPVTCPLSSDQVQTIMSCQSTPAPPAVKLEDTSAISPSCTRALETATLDPLQQADVGSGKSTTVSDEQSSVPVDANKKGSEGKAESVGKVELSVGGSQSGIVNNLGPTTPSSSEQNSPPSTLAPASMGSTSSAVVKVKVEEIVNVVAEDERKLESSLPSATHDEQKGTAGATDLGPRSCSKEDITKTAKEPIKSC